LVFLGTTGQLIITAGGPWVKDGRSPAAAYP